MNYSIDTDSKIYICGGNVRANEFERNLNTNGFLYVEKGDSTLKNQKYQESDYVYIVALQNAMRHEEIVEILYKKGIKRIIYLPMKESNNSRIMRTVYNSLLYEEGNNYINIPEYEKEISLSYSLLDGVVASQNNYVTVMVDINNIFVNDLYPDTKNGVDIEYHGELIAFAEHYRALFDYISGRDYENDKLLQYCSSQGYMDDGGNIIYEKIVDRWELLNVYNRKINNGMDFFISSASLGNVSKDKRIYIREGLHRAIYLLSTGLSYIPIRVDRNQYLNNMKCDSIDIELLLQSNVYNDDRLYLTNPYFYKFCSINGDRIRRIIRGIESYIAKERKEYSGFIEYDGYNASIVRLISKWYKKNNNRFAAIANRNSDYKLFTSLNRIEGTEEVRIIEECKKLTENYDVLLLLDYFKAITSEEFQILLDVIRPKIIIIEADEVDLLNMRCLVKKKICECLSKEGLSKIWILYMNIESEYK